MRRANTLADSSVVGGVILWGGGGRRAVIRSTSLADRASTGRATHVTVTRVLGAEGVAACTRGAHTMVGDEARLRPRPQGPVVSTPAGPTQRRPRPIPLGRTRVHADRRGADGRGVDERGAARPTAGHGSKGPYGRVAGPAAFRRRTRTKLLSFLRGAAPLG